MNISVDDKNGIWHDAAVTPFQQSIITYLKEMAKNDERMVSIEIAVGEICKFYNVTYEQLKSRSRMGPKVRARQMLMYHLRVKCGLSLTRAGAMCNRDHATVLHAIRMVENYFINDYYKIFGIQCTVTKRESSR